ncbi:MAG: hypothetical protein JRC86_04765 [Deltaproteobacteria bacterium]|nr:hypothetical protein [Deltaproteobacteria bacterium]
MTDKCRRLANKLGIDPNYEALTIESTLLSLILESGVDEVKAVLELTDWDHEVRMTNV